MRVHTVLFTLSLHDALPILESVPPATGQSKRNLWNLVLEKVPFFALAAAARAKNGTFSNTKFYRLRLDRSEEHTSELQSHSDLVCRLLLEKKTRHNNNISHI